jgi:CheY-like chemotaxis protein
MKKRPIIIIDDDPDDSQLICDAARELGLTNPIENFTAAKPALEFLLKDTRQPLFILCDINMPVMNGMELREEICKNDFLRMKSIPFLFLTTSGSPQLVLEAYRLQVQGYFIKPNAFVDLTHMLNEVVVYWERCIHPNVDWQ